MSEKAPDRDLDLVDIRFLLLFRDVRFAGAMKSSLERERALVQAAIRRSRKKGRLRLSG